MRIFVRTAQTKGTDYVPLNVDPEARGSKIKQLIKDAQPTLGKEYNRLTYLPPSGGRKIEVEGSLDSYEIPKDAILCLNPMAFRINVILPNEERRKAPCDAMDTVSDLKAQLRKIAGIEDAEFSILNKDTGRTLSDDGQTLQQNKFRAGSTVQIITGEATVGEAVVNTPAEPKAEAPVKDKEVESTLKGNTETRPTRGRGAASSSVTFRTGNVTVNVDKGGDSFSVVMQEIDTVFDVRQKVSEHFKVDIGTLVLRVRDSEDILDKPRKSLQSISGVKDGVLELLAESTIASIKFVSVENGSSFSEECDLTEPVRSLRPRLVTHIKMPQSEMQLLWRREDGSEVTLDLGKSLQDYGIKSKDTVSIKRQSNYINVVVKGSKIPDCSIKVNPSATSVKMLCEKIMQSTGVLVKGTDIGLSTGLTLAKNTGLLKEYKLVEGSVLTIRHGEIGLLVKARVIRGENIVRKSVPTITANLTLKCSFDSTVQEVKEKISAKASVTVEEAVLHMKMKSGREILLDDDRAIVSYDIADMQCILLSRKDDDDDLLDADVQETPRELSQEQMMPSPPPPPPPPCDEDDEVPPSKSEVEITPNTKKTTKDPKEYSSSEPVTVRGMMKDAEQGRVRRRLGNGDIGDDVDDDGDESRRGSAVTDLDEDMVEDRLQRRDILEDTILKKFPRLKHLHSSDIVEHIHDNHRDESLYVTVSIPGGKFWGMPMRMGNSVEELRQKIDSLYISEEYDRLLIENKHIMRHVSNSNARFVELMDDALILGDLTNENELDVWLVGPPIMVGIKVDMSSEIGIMKFEYCDTVRNLFDVAAFGLGGLNIEKANLLIRGETFAYKGDNNGKTLAQCDVQDNDVVELISIPAQCTEKDIWSEQRRQLVEKAMSNAVESIDYSIESLQPSRELESDANKLWEQFEQSTSHLEEEHERFAKSISYLPSVVRESHGFTGMTESGHTRHPSDIPEHADNAPITHLSTEATPSRAISNAEVQKSLSRHLDDLDNASREMAEVSVSSFREYNANDNQRRSPSQKSTRDHSIMRLLASPVNPNNNVKKHSEETDKETGTSWITQPVIEIPEEYLVDSDSEYVPDVLRERNGKVRLGTKGSTQDPRKTKSPQKNYLVTEKKANPISRVDSSRHITEPSSRVTTRGNSVRTNDPHHPGVSVPSDLPQWLEKHLENNPEEYALDIACLEGRLDVVRFLHADGAACSQMAMCWAAMKGYVDILQFLHHYRSEGALTWAMDWAAENGRLDCVQFLHFHRREGCTQYAMDQAASNGHLDVVEFLHMHRKEGCSEEALRNAAYRGHYFVVEFLVTKRPFDCNLQLAYDIAMESKHYKVAELIGMAIKNSFGDPNFKRDEDFREYEMLPQDRSVRKTFDPPVSPKPELRMRKMESFSSRKSAQSIISSPPEDRISSRARPSKEIRYSGGVGLFQNESSGTYSASKKTPTSSAKKAKDPYSKYLQQRHGKNDWAKQSKVTFAGRTPEAWMYNLDDGQDSDDDEDDDDDSPMDVFQVQKQLSQNRRQFSRSVRTAEARREVSGRGAADSAVGVDIMSRDTNGAARRSHVVADTYSVDSAARRMGIPSKYYSRPKGRPQFGVGGGMF